jgi:hypothetical protein
VGVPGDVVKLNVKPHPPNLLRAALLEITWIEIQSALTPTPDPSPQGGGEKKEIRVSR